MKQRRINATLKRALPPIAALALTTFLILTALPQAGTAAPTVASLSTNPKRINESASGSETAAAHSFIRSPFVDSSPGATTRISAAPRLERQPLESLTGLNSTDLEAEAAATERGAPLSAFSVPSVASVVQSPGTTTAADAQNVEFVGQIGGESYAVAVQGDYAYLGVGPRLVVLDISNPANPTLAGQTEVLPDIVWGVAVAGNYAYVADDEGGLRIINVSDPAAPSEAGFYDTPGDARGVAVAGNYAYIADHYKGLRIINVTDPAAPSEAGFYDTSWYAKGVAVAGNYAYVAAVGAGLRIINISDPAAPSEVGFYYTPGEALGVAVTGNYAYVAVKYVGSLRIINVSNPAAPTEAGFYGTPAGLAYGVAVAGNYAYVADGSGGLRIINVSNPAAPEEAGFYDTPGKARGVAVAGNYAYVADWDSLRIINVSDPAAPTEAGFYATPGMARGVAVAGNNYAYVTDWVGLHIINVSNPAAPTEAGFYDTPGLAEGVAVAGNYAYVAAASRGLRIINVSNPAAPTEAGFYDMGYAKDVAVAGNYAYVADGGSLRIINVSSPTAPTEAGSYGTLWDARGVAVAGDYAYVANWYGLHIINVSNPVTPTLAGFYDTPGSARGVAVAGNYAYVADGVSLRIIDVSNPAALTEAGFYDTPGGAYGVAVAGNYTYVADGEGGLFILRFTGGPGPTPGENPPTTPAPPPSTPTDEMFDGTDPTEGYKYAEQGPIEIDIVIDRYYGQNDNGTLDSSYIGKSVAEYSWLTIQAFDVDPDEVDRVFVNDHEVGQLTGVDGGWWPDSFPIPTDWLHFPDLSSGAVPPDTTHAHNTIRIEIDEGGQGWATQVAWARFMVPGTRPVLLVHGLDIVKEILCRSPFCDLTPYHNGWNPWQNWVNADGSKGFLAEYRFPNVQSTTENGTQGPRTGEAESDVRAYTDGLKSYKDNSADIIAHILKVKYRYGVDKVNLVGHSKGGVDVRATWKRLQSMGLEDAVENAIVLGTPNEGLGEGLIGWLASLFQSDVLHELSPVGMFRFNTDEGHGAYDQYFLYTVAGNKSSTPWGYLEKWLSPNDGVVAVSSVHGDLIPSVPPDYIRTETMATDHSGLHSEEFVFTNTVRPLLQPIAFDGAGAMSYATRQAGSREEAPVRPISSGAAGNPVQYPSPIVGTISSCEVLTHTIAIDGDAASVSLMWGYADSMGLTLYDPQGQEIDPSASAAITYTASITDKTVGYILEGPEAGQWTAQITATNTYTDGEEYLLVTAVSSTITVTAEVDKDWYAVNEPVQISANLRHGPAPVTGAVVTATVFFSGTTAATTNLYDDGLHGDGAADDGWYTNTFTDTSQIGYYLILVSAEGTSGGTAFSRVTSTQAAVASTGASLNDSYAEGLFDTNGDGLYNTLVITTGVRVTDTASYRLVGMLTDTEGNYVVDAATEITLTVGVTDIPLLFSGETIARSGLDGPYQLRNLALLDLSSATPVRADYRALAYTTSAYTYNQFQRDPIIVSIYATDQGVDTNGNGKHDLLRVNASIDVRYAGTYTVTARLLDADWQDVASVYTTTNLVTGTNAISLDFNGAAISALRRDGPYRVGDVVITYGFDPVTYLLISDFYTTQAYNYTDFDVAILQVVPVALTFYAQEGGANPPPKSVGIANTGGGLLDWTATEDADWLSINPTSGAVPVSMSVSVDVAGLSADIYTGTITVTATISGTQNSPQEVTARLCNLFGDLNCDCVVNVADIMEVASRWRMTDDDPEWESRYDLDGDGIITVVDIMKVAANWGETCE